LSPALRFDISVSMKPSHAAALALVGWYLMVRPLFSPKGTHPRAFNDLNASLNN